MPASLLARVRAVPGVADAAGELTRSGIALLENGTTIGGTLESATLGGAWISDPQLSPYTLTSGSAPTAAGNVVIDADSATAGHLRVGDTVQFAFTGSATQAFRVSGIADFGVEPSEAGYGFALFTPPVAEQLLQAGNTYDSIVVSARSSFTELQLRDRVASALHGSAVQVQTGGSAASQAEQNAVTTINQEIGTPLLVFAFIAVFVGTFLIVNTFSILVAQRTRELALLRAIGAIIRNNICPCHTKHIARGAQGRNRTHDLRLTKASAQTGPISNTNAPNVRTWGDAFQVLPLALSWT